MHSKTSNRKFLPWFFCIAVVPLALGSHVPAFATVKELGFWCFSQPFLNTCSSFQPTNPDEVEISTEDGGSYILVCAEKWTLDCPIPSSAPVENADMNDAQHLEYRLEDVSHFLEPQSAASVTEGAFNFSTANTNHATVNTASQWFFIPAGAALIAGTCGVIGSSGQGDTYLRLKDDAGQEVMANNDSCGVLSNISFLAPGGGPDRFYELQAGCYGSSSCSGTVGFVVVDPSVTNRSFDFDAANTSFATVNTANEWVYAPPGATLTVGTCEVDESWGAGDTYLRLYDAVGQQVAANDDSCGLLSKLSFTVPGQSVGFYEVRGGCYSNGSCRGAIGYRIDHSEWTGWMDRDNASGSGDYETLSGFVDSGQLYPSCAVPITIECETTGGVDWTLAGEVYTCDVDTGGVCRNSEQQDGYCQDYRVRFECAQPTSTYFDDVVIVEDGLVPTSIYVPNL